MGAKGQAAAENDNSDNGLLELLGIYTEGTEGNLRLHLSVIVFHIFLDFLYLKLIQ